MDIVSNFKELYITQALYCIMWIILLMWPTSIIYQNNITNVTNLHPWRRPRYRYRIDVLSFVWKNGNTEDISLFISKHSQFVVTALSFPLQQQLKYEMTGSDSALRYYYIDPLSGLVTLKRLLTDSSNADDQVLNFVYLIILHICIRISLFTYLFYLWFLTCAIL